MSVVKVIKGPELEQDREPVTLSETTATDRYYVEYRAVDGVLYMQSPNGLAVEIVDPTEDGLLVAFDRIAIYARYRDTAQQQTLWERIKRFFRRVS